MISALAKLDRARALLAESRTLKEVKNVRDIAEAARTYAKAAKLGHEAQNYAAEIALLAARKAGAILKQLQKSDGGRPKKTAASVAGVSEYRRTLKDTGTPERTARHWQKLANVPEKVAQEYIRAAKENGEVTASGLLRASWKVARESQPPAELPCGTYRVVYADPPWDYGGGCFEIQQIGGRCGQALSHDDD